jgi:hypothetical protein
MAKAKTLNDSQRKALLGVLKTRFEKHMKRHSGLTWDQVQSRLEKAPEQLWSLQQMEESGGEPDVVAFGTTSKEFHFVDCAAESPSERRSLCYDDEALAARKENKPKGSAVAMAAAMGVELLTEAQYRELQALGEFDKKTSSWVQTPADIRKLGGAVFCDRRYNTVFLYHNGAESYYAARGFRGVLKV